MTVMTRIPVMKKPLVTHIFTADPSAHVFGGKIYIYPSHDLDNDLPHTHEGDHFDMKDYHVLSISDFNSPVVDHGEVLHLRDVPWASRQMWAPDAAFKNGTYYLYFPAKDKQGIFRIGAATSAFPYGPFTPEPEPIEGSFSIDPAVFTDDDGKTYLYFGGLRGGQLERWRTGRYDPRGRGPAGDEPALGPRLAMLTPDMLGIDGPVGEIIITDERGYPLRAGDLDRRYFEGPWLHKYRGKYYFSYSTGDTRYLVYAVGDNPLGPFTYQGRILNPVVGWTTHHSIVEFQGTWYLFYHGSSFSGGVTHKRCIKYMELKYNADGTIQTHDPY
jgi:hypothetical protein